MKYILIGHRGSGKTSLMKRLVRQAQKQGVGLLGIDLDEEIENRHNCVINSFFEDGKESEFREIEQDVLNSIVAEWDSSPIPVVVSVGAGYTGKFPADWEIVWVRREVDKNGRVFLDRALFDKTKTPIEDYLSRFEPRQDFFKKSYDWALTVQEGAELGKGNEWRLFNPSNQLSRTVFTFQSHHVSSKSKMKKLVAALTRLGVDTVEYRDDFLSAAQIDKLMIEAADFYSIMSLRKSKDDVDADRLKNFDFVDWPGEWGGPAIFTKIISFHERAENESLTDVLKRVNLFDDGKVMIKLAVPIKNFSELIEAHEWGEGSPDRLFYPTSNDGRWQWYRMAFPQAKGFNFIRLDEGVVLDQPTPMEWVNHRNQGQPFLAVLGDPIEHSRSPMEHLEFCNSHNMNFYRIKLNEDEFSDENLKWLNSIGMIGAAVTSPFKEKAYDLSVNPDETVKSLNTLVWDQSANCWRGTNTDLEGLRSFLEHAKEMKPVIWGGGGILHPVRNLLPDCVGVSSRDSHIKFAPDELANEDIKNLRPETLIWAVGRNHQTENWPPAEWQPRVVVDLNYTEDSPGREYALRLGSIYQSGLELFSIQAEAQREFWRNYVGQSNG